MVLSGLSLATAQRDTNDRRAGAGQGQRTARGLFLLFVRNRERRLALEGVFKTVVRGLCGACRHMPLRMLGAAFYRSCLFMIRRPARASAIFHHLVSISRRRGFSFNCACQLELVSQNVMAAQRASAASPESAENYSTTCQFYCVVITKTHQQTLTIPCLLRWCGEVNLRSGEMSSSAFGRFNAHSSAFIARAGNCLSRRAWL